MLNTPLSAIALQTVCPQDVELKIVTTIHNNHMINIACAKPINAPPAILNV